MVPCCVIPFFFFSKNSTIKALDLTFIWIICKNSNHTPHIKLFVHYKDFILVHCVVKMHSSADLKLGSNIPLVCGSERNTKMWVCIASRNLYSKRVHRGYEAGIAVIAAYLLLVLRSFTNTCITAEQSRPR
jgi:hypothetical protein